MVIPSPLQWVKELNGKYARGDQWVFLIWLRYASALEMRPGIDAS